MPKKDAGTVDIMREKEATATSNSTRMIRLRMVSSCMAHTSRVLSMFSTISCSKTQENFLFFFFFFSFLFFCFVLFCFVLFCFVLFCFVLFCFLGQSSLQQISLIMLTNTISNIYEGSQAKTQPALGVRKHQRVHHLSRHTYWHFHSCCHYYSCHCHHHCLLLLSWQLLFVVVAITISMNVIIRLQHIGLICCPYNWSLTAQCSVSVLPSCCRHGARSEWTMA